MPTPKQYADALSATPRNSWKYLADAMQPVSEFADEFKVKQDIPLIGGMSAADFTGLKGAFGLADDASYGKYPIRGASLQTTKVDPRVIDAMGLAGALMPVAKNVGKAALGEAARQIHTGTGIGRAALDPRMNIFAGSRAETANRSNLMRAIYMQKDGVPDESIYAKTGWFFGSADNKPRFEIPDDLAKISDDVYNGIKTDKEFQGPINQGLTHDKLYEAYPELGDIKASFYASKEPAGTYSAPTDTITIGGSSTGLQRSVALHELQHAIQQTQGFARGGSPEMFEQSEGFNFKQLQDAAILDKTMRASNFDQLEALNRFKELFGRKPEPGAFAALERIGSGEELDMARDAAELAVNPYDSYHRLAGEAEARLTQSRKNMTAPERAASYPPSMFDVPVKDQIVRYGDDVARQKERK